MKILFFFLVYISLVPSSFALSKSEKGMFSTNYNNFILSEHNGNQILVSKERKPSIIFTTKNGTEFILKNGIYKFVLNSNLGKIELFLKNNLESKKIGLYLSGPRIYFNTGPNCTLKASSEPIDILKAKIDGLVPVSGLIDDSCDSFGIDKMKLTKIYTIGINSEEIKVCLSDVDFKVNLQVDKLLVNLKEKYAKAKLELESKQTSNLILKCATSFDSSNKDIMFSEKIGAKLNVGFIVNPINKDVIVSDKKSNCRKNIEYSFFHEMLHVSGLKLESSVDEIVNKCRKLNNDSCDDALVENTLEVNQIGILTKGRIVANDQTVDFNEKLSEQKTEQLASLVPLDASTPIPEKVIREIQDNPVNSPEFNNGMQLLANNMIGKMNSIEDAINKSYSATQASATISNSSNTNGTKTTNTIKPFYQPMKISEMVNDPQIGLEPSTRYNSIPYNEAKQSNNNDKNTKQNLSKLENNRLPASIAKPSLAKFVPEMPYLGSTIDSGLKNNPINEAKANSNGNQKIVEKAATAIKQLIAGNKPSADEWKELKPALLDKNGQDILFRMRIAIVDKKMNKVFGYKDKDPAWVFEDNGEDIKLSPNVRTL